MSIQSEIERINTNVQSSLSLIADEGVDIAEGANSDALPDAIAALIADIPCASIFVTGLSESDTVSASKDGKTVQGEWVTKKSQTEDTNTLLLLHGEDMTDSSASANGITNSGVAVSSDQSKFGGKSLYFNGGALLTLTGGITLGTGDFTVELWIYSSATTNAYRRWISSSIGGFASGTFCLRENANGTIETSKFATTAALTRNAWNHVAAVRASGTLTVYLNGVAVGSVADSTNYSEPVRYIGGHYNGSSEYHVGYMDEIRISNIARWTANFTPPTEMYTNMIAVDGSGFEIAPIKSFGTWTVTATNGEETATQDVLVDVVAEYEIEMDLNNILWLYREGDECEEVTGGWYHAVNAVNGGYIVKEESRMLLYEPYSDGFICVRNPLPLSKYTKMTVEWGRGGSSSAYAAFSVVNVSSDGFVLDDSTQAFVYQNQTLLTSPWSFDIDSNSQNTRIFYGQRTESSGYFYVTNVWLE